MGAPSENEHRQGDQGEAAERRHGGLERVELGVEAAAHDQLGVGAGLDDHSSIDDLVGHTHSREAVGHYECDAAAALADRRAP